MDMKTKFPHLILAGATALAFGGVSLAARAATPLGEYLTVSGFGTLGGVVTNSNEGQFGRDRQAGGADKHPALDVDSNFGLQVDAKATSWLSATVQTLTAKRDTLGFATRIEWAYVLVKPLDGLSIRGGHFQTPAFLVSDSRQIGYANNWLRPPNEVYGLNAIDSFDGVDATYRRGFGPVSLSVTGIAGSSKFRVIGFDGKGDRLRGLSLQLETDWATLRAGRVTANAAVEGIATFDEPYSFTGYGVTIDHGNLVAQAEFVQRRSSKSSDVINSDGWYVMGGWRFDKLLPYAILSRTAPKVADFPAHASNTQRTAAVGLRWDAFRSADIKFQIERIDTSGTTGISFTTPTLPATGPGPAPSGTVNRPVTAFSVALDFTF